MPRTILRLRRNQNGFALIGKALLVVVLGIAAAVGWFVVYQDEVIKVEVRVHNIDSSRDPIKADLDVRVTNNGSKNLLVEHLEIKVWADAARTILLSEARIEQLSVPAGPAPVTATIPIEIHNAGAFGAAVWVDLDGVWWEGSEQYNRHIEGREISVGDALERLL